MLQYFAALPRRPDESDETNVPLNLWQKGQPTVDFSVEDSRVEGDAEAIPGETVRLDASPSEALSGSIQRYH